MGETEKEDVAQIGEDKSLRIGSAHGADTDIDEKVGYARDISGDVRDRDSGINSRVGGSASADASGRHPSRSLPSRSGGFGIGGGYEKPYRKEKSKPADSKGMYGPIPHSGYYGAGAGARPFKKDQASFSEELDWYRLQYGESTSGYEKRKK
jgi:hypothetical protein